MNNSYIIKKSSIPNQCNSSLINDEKTCKYCNSYMFVFSTGEQLFSCGIKKHINNIESLISTKRSIYVFKKNITDTEYDKYNYDKYDYEYTIEKMKHTHDPKFITRKKLRSIIHYTHNSSILIRNCFTNIKLNELLELMSNTNAETYHMLEKEYDNCIALSIRYNTLVKFNVEYNEIYKKHFVIYMLPFQKSNTCSICFEETSGVNSGNLPCGHAFHFNCITHWFNSCKDDTHKSCPNCRTSFDVSKYRFSIEYH